MKKLLPTALAATLFAVLPAAHADTLKMACNISGAMKPYCEHVKQRFESETPHKLEFIEMPAASDEKLALYQQIFAAKDGSAVDVLSVDVIWVGLLDKHLYDLTDKVKDLEPAFFPNNWKNNVVNGRIKAVPGQLDAGMLYYRKDLLEKYKEQPPKTWEELTRIATKIQKAERDAGQKNMWGLVFQGKAYEGLGCDVLEWVASYNGGTFVDPAGNITINNPKAAKALNTAASWVGTIAPKGVMGYQEEESRAVFQNGDAVFMRNWPYAYLLTQDKSSPVKGKVGVVPIPMGGEDGQHAATLGGWQWAVSAYSKNPEAGAKLVRILSEAETQKRAFLLLGIPPARIESYQDAEVQAKAPYLAEFKDVFANAVPRPSTPTRSQFPKVSKAVFNAGYDVLSGRATGEQAVADLEEKLKRIKGREWK
ncbi:ABC transporter substrate-binding protein [Azoarcus sp. KH32C]|uniref:ABC transporter substrate-binding protein n=1 Tax=Azoarcus sp. KH32C TaxID=748247 RepID=UPI0002386EEC|nr:ABC transporter substrate-binding protein [Azoarcus sp. KH32C]BAL24983.1 extracellular solute-binding protein family 1, multiple sugar transport system substrate-binding protein [Azoarcus sp. KH32C]